MSTQSQYETHTADGDQRNAPGPNPDVGMHHTDDRKDHEKGQPESHQSLDSKDEKSIKNKLAQAGKEAKEEAEAEKAKEEAEAEKAKAEEKPTDAARKNGNSSSRGAKIDEQIEEEERKMLEAKGIKV